MGFTARGLSYQDPSLCSNQDGTHGWLTTDDEDFDGFSVGLGVAMDVEYNNVYRWASEKHEPTAEAMAEIVRALGKLNSEASRAFVQHYLGTGVSDFSALEKF
jgi:hypothetical protein